MDFQLKKEIPVEANRTLLSLCSGPENIDSEGPRSSKSLSAMVEDASDRCTVWNRYKRLRRCRSDIFGLEVGFVDLPLSRIAAEHSPRSSFRIDGLREPYLH